MSPPEIVVTGRGVVSSIGEGAEAFFDALLAKKSGIADGIGACTEFDPEAAMTPKEARRSDRYTHLAVAAATQAAEEAGCPTASTSSGSACSSAPASAGCSRSSSSAATSSRAASARCPRTSCR